MQKAQVPKMGTWRVEVLKGHNDPLAKSHTKVVVGQKDQLPKSTNKCNTFSFPNSNGNKNIKNVPDF